MSLNHFHFIYCIFCMWTSVLIGKIIENPPQDHIKNVCDVFFKDGTIPTGFPYDRVDSAFICQMLNDKAEFGTYYSKALKIPIYSAYTLDTGGHGSRSGVWYIEPGFNPAFNVDNMRDFRDMNDSDIVLQATNENYIDENDFDRGHLNPNSFHVGDGREATFTLTNIVPQHKPFNQGIWATMEDLTKTYMADCLNVGTGKKMKTGTGTAYFITGVIPGTNLMKGIVNIPNEMYTVTCCNKPNPDDSFSFGFKGTNVDRPTLQIGTVTSLQQYISRVQSESIGGNINFFNCNNGNNVHRDIILTLAIAKVDKKNRKIMKINKKKMKDKQINAWNLPTLLEDL